MSNPVKTKDLSPELQAFIESWVQVPIRPVYRLPEDASSVHVVREVILPDMIPTFSVLDKNYSNWDWNNFAVRVAHATYFCETQTASGFGTQRELLSEVNLDLQHLKFRDLCTLVTFPSQRPVTERPYFILKSGVVIKPFLIRTSVHRISDVIKVEDIATEELLLSNNFYMRLLGKEKAKLAKQNEQALL